VRFDRLCSVYRWEGSFHDSAHKGVRRQLYTLAEAHRAYMLKDKAPYFTWATIWDHCILLEFVLVGTCACVRIDARHCLQLYKCSSRDNQNAQRSGDQLKGEFMTVDVVAHITPAQIEPVIRVYYVHEGSQSPKESEVHSRRPGCLALLYKQLPR
jgi:hypothetical protein